MNRLFLSLFDNGGGGGGGGSDEDLVAVCSLKDGFDNEGDEGFNRGIMPAFSEISLL